MNDSYVLSVFTTLFIVGDTITLMQSAPAGTANAPMPSS